MNNIKTYTLSEIAKSIQIAILSKATGQYWIKAEMNKLSHYSYSGHAYPELVEKKDGKVIAQFKGTIWKSDFIRINNQFKNILKEELKDGIKILFLAKVTYDAIHGINLHILDIDPSYTLGDLEQEKQATILKLNSEHLFNQNKTLTVPLLPKRIAIISVKTSKGYADFMKVLDNYQSEYKIFHFLFPSILQGDKALIGIMSQLDYIKKIRHLFDLVVIVRGGGGDVGLSCYNDYELSKQIATFPLPVWTGIGHATNETVVEMVANYNAITPTHLAEHLINYFKTFSHSLKQYSQKLNYKSKQILSQEHKLLTQQINLFQKSTQNIFLIYKNLTQQSQNILLKYPKQIIEQEKNKITLSKEKLLKTSQSLISDTKQQIQVLDKNMSLLDPKNILKRGFSITYFENKSITSTAEVKEGDMIITELYDGKLISQIKNQE